MASSPNIGEAMYHGKFINILNNLYDFCLGQQTNMKKIFQNLAEVMFFFTNCWTTFDIEMMTCWHKFTG